MKLITFEQIAGGKNLVNQVNDLVTNLSDFDSRLQAVQSMSELLEERKTLTTTSEISFNTEKEPNNTTVKLLINGVIYEEDDAFTCDRSEKTVIWTATSSNNGFDLTTKIADHITIYYYSGFSVSTSSELKMLRMDNIPTTGTYSEGDMIFKIHPTESNNIGWIYTSQGKWMEIGITDFKNTFNVNSSDGNTFTPQITANEFSVTQSDLPFITTWDVPTTGPIVLQVTKEIEESITTTEETNSTTFNSTNASSITIEGNTTTPAVITIDDDGIRAKDCYVDQVMDLQMFSTPNNGLTPTQGQVMEWDSQMIITDSKFDLTGINISDFLGLSVQGSVGENNFVGLVLRYKKGYSDFGTGIAYDFEENKWVSGMTDYYNLASWTQQKREDTLYGQNVIFDTNFLTSMETALQNNTSSEWEAGIFTLRSIPINKLNDIPIAKWQELFDPNVDIEWSSKCDGGFLREDSLSSGEWNSYTPTYFEPSDLEIAFLFAYSDVNQPCRITKLSMKKQSSNGTTTKQVPAITPDDFTYNIITGTGKSSVRFEWTGWSIGMTGLIFPKTLYHPISS